MRFRGRRWEPRNTSSLPRIPQSGMRQVARLNTPMSQRPTRGIMWVTFGHLRPSGHIMPDHAGDRGAVLLDLAPHDHLHIKQKRIFVPSAAVHKHTARPTVRRARNQGLLCSQRREEPLITARRPADLYRRGIRGAYQMRRADRVDLAWRDCRPGQRRRVLMLDERVRQARGVLTRRGGGLVAWLDASRVPALSPGLLAGNPPPRWGAPGDDAARSQPGRASADPLTRVPELRWRP